MKAIPFLLVIFGASFFSMNAQRGIANPESPNSNPNAFNIMFNADDIWTQSYYINKNSKKYAYFEGSPWVSREYLPAKIYSGTTLKEDNLLMRYNVYTDIMEIDIPEKNTGEEPDDSVVKASNVVIEIANKRYVYNGDFVKENGKVGTYFEEMFQGKTYTLYKKNNVTLIPAKKGENSYIKDRPSTFKQTETYYLLDLKTQSFIEIPGNKNKVAKLFEGSKSEIKMFIYKARIDMNKEKDMIRLGRFFDRMNTPSQP